MYEIRTSETSVRGDFDETSRYNLIFLLSFIGERCAHH